MGAQHLGLIVDGLQHSIASLFDRWRAEWRSVGMARAIYPALWEDVRRKIPDASAIDLTEYAQVRAAQLAQEQVDAIMRTNRALTGAFASRLQLKATDRAVASVLEATATARRAARARSSELPSK